MDENLSLEEVIKSLNDGELGVLVGMLAGQIAEKVMKRFELEHAPEYVFSTIIYALIDMWLDKQGRKNTNDFAEFVSTVMQAGVETLQEEEKEVQN